MTDETKTLEIEKLEVPEETERTRDCPCFVPRSDIWESGDRIVVVTDLPGATADALDITLEKNVLTINAYVDTVGPEGYALALSEYQVGDFQRSFRLSDVVDQDNIEAVFDHGVLRLYLPKAIPKSLKIGVKTT